MKLLKLTGADIREHDPQAVADRLLDDPAFRNELWRWIHGEFTKTDTKTLKEFVCTTSQAMAEEYNNSKGE